MTVYTLEKCQCCGRRAFRVAGASYLFRLSMAHKGDIDVTRMKENREKYRTR